MVEFFQLVRTEEQSILEGSSVSDYDTRAILMTDLHFRDGAHSTYKDTNNGKKEFVIFLKQAYRVLTSFIYNRQAKRPNIWPHDDQRITMSEFWLGTDREPFSTKLTKCATEIHDSGIIPMDLNDCKSREFDTVTLRRDKIVVNHEFDNEFSYRDEVYINHFTEYNIEECRLY